MFIHVSFAEPPKRIVSLAPAMTEIIYALGAGQLMVGVSDYCDEPAQAQSVPKVGGFINPHIEKIVSLKPDVVFISQNGGQKYVKEQLERLHIATCVVSAYTIPLLYDAYRDMGERLDREREAAELTQMLKDTITRVEQATHTASRPRVLFVRSHVPLMIAGAGTFEHDIVRIAGGAPCPDNDDARKGKRYPQYTEEELFVLNPDVIIDATYYETPTGDEWRELRAFWSRFAGIRAVKDNTIYCIKTDIHSVPGPRTPAFIMAMACLLHPELFGEEQKYCERIR